MRNIKLLLQYDGTGYRGWQRQGRGEPTVQAELEACVMRLTGRGSTVLGAGRTDAGVHALGQVASFRTHSDLSVRTIRRALNATLPGDIRVVRAEEAAETFHPRKDAVLKRYVYLVSNGEFVSPFTARYSWHLPGRLDVGAMRRAADSLVGSRDFRAFMGSGSGVIDTVRNVGDVSVRASSSIGFLGFRLTGRFLRVTVEAEGFLRHMVRNIAGTLAEVGRGRLGAEDLGGIIDSCDRAMAGPTAPARGLFLERVSY